MKFTTSVEDVINQGTVPAEFIAVYIDSYVTMSSDLYGTCRHCFYGTRFGYCSKGTKSSSDNIVPIFIRPII